MTGFQIFICFMGLLVILGAVGMIWVLKKVFGSSNDPDENEEGL